ncbi:PadR family transcriptional regulator [Candidatus Bathyarchaeota archaeon]|nr:PadR family transcriptional regulator [Candidatus Bathyarchaeota archaeon]
MTKNLLYSNITILYNYNNKEGNIMDSISNKEASLLGLLCEKPKHAYEIEMDIKERDMRYWTEISMSSVYKLLKKLEERKFLKSEVKLSKNNVAQKIYSITDQGKNLFKEKLKELVSTWQPSIHPVDIGLANLNLLNKQDAIKELNKYSESIDKMIKCYIELEKFLMNSKCPLGNIQLATRRIYLLKGEKKWLNDFQEDFVNEG